MLTANRIQRLFDSLENSPWTTFSGWAAAAPHSARFWSGDEGVVIELDAPGLAPEQIEVAIERQQVSVSTPRTPAEANVDYRFSERASEGGAVTFQLPFAVHPNHTEVNYLNGVLRISVRKPEEEQPRKLVVKAG